MVGEVRVGLKMGECCRHKYAALVLLAFAVLRAGRIAAPATSSKRRRSACLTMHILGNNRDLRNARLVSLCLALIYTSKR